MEANAGYRGYDRLVLSYKLSSCRSNCVFCHSGDEEKRIWSAPFPKVKEIVEKLGQWKRAWEPSGFKIHLATVSMDHPHTADALALHERFNPHSLDDEVVVMLGGLKHRPEPELRSWFTTLVAAGAQAVGMTFWGPRELHDAWCGGKRGEYDFMMRAARLAPECGLRRMEHVFLTRSGLPHLDAVLEELDQMPGQHRRFLFPLNYGGRAIRLEHERLRKEEWDALPERYASQLRHRDLRTEGEWMAFVASAAEDQPMLKVMRLSIDRSSVDRLEAMSAEEIMDGLVAEHDQYYAAVPDFRMLAARYGDPANDRVYGLGDVETKWSLRHYQEHPAPFPALKNRLFWSLRPVPRA